MENLRIVMGPKDQFGTLMAFELTDDSDQDGLFGLGDVLTIKEPSPGFLTPTAIGTLMDVTVSLIPGATGRLTQGTSTAEKPATPLNDYILLEKVSWTP